MAVRRAFAAHLDKMASEPGSYGALGLSDLFEMREECLREFALSDVYRWASGGPGRRSALSHGPMGPAS